MAITVEKTRQDTARIILELAEALLEDGDLIINAVKELRGELAAEKPRTSRWVALRVLISSIRHLRRSIRWARRLAVLYEQDQKYRAQVVAYYRMIDPLKTDTKAEEGWKHDKLHPDL